MPVLNSLTFTLADGAWETSQTTGTGSYTLDGAKVNSGITYRTLLAALGNGARTLYVARMGTGWEVALGTISSPGTLSRDSILASSNSNNAVSWAAGTKDIQVDISAALANQIWARPGAGFAMGAVETRAAQVPSGSSSVVDFAVIANTAQLIYINYTLIRSDLSQLFIQLGDSGGLEATGYSSVVHGINTVGAGVIESNTAAFLLAHNGVAGMTQVGLAILSRSSATLWHMMGNCSSMTAGNNNSGSASSGAKTFTGGPLDRFRIAAGANFNAGGSVSATIIHGVT